MKDHSRRDVITTLASSALAAVWPLRATHSVESKLGADPFGGGNYMSRSGDDDLDRAMIIELKRIVRVFSINPGFKYINAMDAYATTRVIVAGTDGTVLLGLPLIRNLLEKNDGGAGVAGVCAHECAHVLQWKYGFDKTLQSGEPTVRNFELHADFLAGYYMGRRRADTHDQIKIFSLVTYNFGDYNVGDVTSHGTPGQRAAAVERGYQAAVEGSSVMQAAQMGLSYVKNL